MRKRASSILFGLLIYSTYAGADPVLQWNGLMIDAIRNDNSGPTVSSRNLAILHTAIYDAVNSVEYRYEPYLFHELVIGETSQEAAAVGAAFEVMKVLYPSFQARSDELYIRFLTNHPSTPALTNGLALGSRIAMQALGARSADGSNTEVPYIPSDDAGQWRRTPPFFRPPVTPHWGYILPFALTNLAPFLPPPPPALDSAEYATALNEIKAYGGMDSSLRTAEQRQVAVFWSDFSYTSMPPGHWHLIAADIARERNTTLNENARLFALLSMAQADAAIVCWDAKFRYNLWRPVTAIHRANEDGNPLTEADPAWNHLLGAPPFPAYISGHSAFSKASATVLAAFFQTDAITFTASSDTLPGVYRTFNSFAACADEIGMSRIYGGIHFSFDNIEGKRSGDKIGTFVATNFLKPVRTPVSLRVTSASSEGVRMQFNAPIGYAYILQSSSDLRRWSTLQSGVTQNESAEIFNQMEMHNSSLFYRVVAQ
ncbi:MAG: phosphatase PAP2 family protein [Verrucomicrobiales bacterium]